MTEPASSQGTLATADEIYGTAGALLERVAAGAGFREALANIKALLCFHVFQPAASVILDCRAGGEPTVRFGEPPSAESTVIVLEARSLHTLFLGLLNPARALHEGEILVRGPRSHAVQRILPLFRSVLAPLYVDQLREKDRLDLVPEALQPLTSDSEGAP